MKRRSFLAAGLAACMPVVGGARMAPNCSATRRKSIAPAFATQPYVEFGASNYYFAVFTISQQPG